MPRWIPLLVFPAVVWSRWYDENIGDEIVPNKNTDILTVTSFNLKPLDGNQIEAKFDIDDVTRERLTDCFILEKISGKYYVRGRLSTLPTLQEPLETTVHLDPCSNFTVLVLVICFEEEKLLFKEIRSA